MLRMGRDLATVAGAYAECALWSSVDEDGDPLDTYDAAPETAARFREDCADFLALLEREGIGAEAWSDEQLGHDLWLTRNRHGAGFWDRGHGPTGDRLTALAHPYGEAYLYVGDDGMVYHG